MIKVDKDLEDDIEIEIKLKKKILSIEDPDKSITKLNQDGKVDSLSSVINVGTQTTPFNQNEESKNNLT